MSLAFWREDKLRQIVPAVVEQLPTCIRLATTEGKAALPRCLDAITEAVSDDALLKSMNLNLLMHTRSEDVRLRTFALVCSEVLWQSHGGKLQGKRSNAATQTLSLMVVQATSQK